MQKDFQSTNKIFKPTKYAVHRVCEDYFFIDKDDKTVTYQ